MPPHMQAAFFYSSVVYRDWVLAHLLRHFGLPDEVRRGAIAHMADCC